MIDYKGRPGFKPTKRSGLCNQTGLTVTHGMILI